MLDRAEVVAHERTVVQATRQRIRSVPIGQMVAHAVLIVASLVSVFPLVWMISGSFKNYKDLVSSKALLPQVWTLNNYTEIIGRVNFGAAFRNSTIVAVSVTVTAVLTSSALGFIFAKITVTIIFAPG